MHERLIPGLDLQTADTASKAGRPTRRCMHVSHVDINVRGEKLQM